MLNFAVEGRYMKNLLISLPICFVLLFCATANAQRVNTDGLTEEQKAELALQAAKMKTQNNTPAPGGILSEELSPEKLNEWVDLGKNIGMAVAATAKELGVAADEFLQSTTGKITVVLIVWKVMGEDIIGVVGGSIAWLVLANIVLWSFRYFHMTKRVVNKEGKVEYVKRYEFREDNKGGSEARVTSVIVHLFVFALVTIMCAIAIF